jgi:hypothetical protein
MDGVDRVPEGLKRTKIGRVGKAKRAHPSDNELDRWWARRKRAFAHPTRHDFPTKNPTPIATTLSIIAAVDSQPSQ